MPYPITPQNVRNANRSELHRAMREESLMSPARQAAKAELRRRRNRWRLLIGGGATSIVGGAALGVAIASALRLLFR